MTEKKPKPKLIIDTEGLITKLGDGLHLKLDEVIKNQKKEIKILMATQADVDAITAQLEDVKTEVGKVGSDLQAFIASNPGVSLDALKAKANEVAAALQAVDDTLPEQA